MNLEGFNSETKVWSGPKHDVIYNSNISLGSLILNVLKKTPEVVAQVSADDGVELTCHELRLRTMKIASHLISSGYKQGDVVGMITTNTENLSPLVFSCLTLGLPINTLAPVMVESDIVHMYSRTKPKIIFCDANIIKTVEAATKKLPQSADIFTLDSKVEGIKFVGDIIAIDFDEENFILPELHDIANSPAIILCSSGTTGLPKGVCKSHSQVITQVFRMWNIESSKQEVIFNFSTLYWATGVYFLIIPTLYGMKRIITSRVFNADLMIEIINRFKVNIFLSPPSSVAQLLQKKTVTPLESVKIFMVGGSVVSKSICEAMKPYLPNGVIAPVYGTSEGDFLAISFASQRFGSVGKLSHNVQMKVIDESERQLGPNQEGEICFKTPVTFLGYFDDLEKTQETVRDGWIYTGDIGYFDSDEFLFIVDRKKDMLKFNNFQVYPSELEAIIGEVEGVAASCVVGVFEENQGNDLIFAFVIKDSNSRVLESEIIDYVHSRVIDAKKLRGGVHFVEAFPMTPSGKVLKNEVKKLAQAIYDK